MALCSKNLKDSPGQPSYLEGEQDVAAFSMLPDSRAG
jgi:hypothetical protein